MEQTMMQLSGAVAHDLHLELLPARAATPRSAPPLTGLASRPRLQISVELFHVVGDAAAGAAEREARADDHREADATLDQRRASSMLWAMPERAGRGPILVIASLNLRRSSALSIASSRGADQLDAVLVEHAVAAEVERAVERGLAAHGRQERVRGAPWR